MKRTPTQHQLQKIDLNKKKTSEKEKIEKEKSLSLRKIIQALHLIYCVSSFPPADNLVEEKLNSTNITSKQIKYSNERWKRNRTIATKVPQIQIIKQFIMFSHWITDDEHGKTS